MTCQINIFKLRCIAIMIGCFPALTAASQTQITPDNLTDHHVGAAIRALVDEVYARQNEDNNWEPETSGSMEMTQRGGYTALAVLSLLYAGETYQEERLRKAVTYLEDLEMIGSYAVAVRANVWALLPPRFLPHLRRDKAWLLEGFSEQAAGWTYKKEPYTPRRDNSITQYGALALWEIAKRDERIESRYWKLMEDRFINMQLADGGWNYTGGGPAYGSMTAAGLTVLFITQDFLHADDSIRLGNDAQHPYERSIALGLDWMNNNFSATTNPGRGTDFYYYMYGVERVGLASGYKYFGDHDWYREGAAELIRLLCDWDPETGTMIAHRHAAGEDRAGRLRTIDLNFALMFLSRGRLPGAINKLADPSMKWNNRPRDVANLTRWIRGRSESGVNWQVVSIDANAEDWLDAPVLYLASNEPPPWIPSAGQRADELAQVVSEHRARVAAGEASDTELASTLLPKQLVKLKTYLDLGGMLWAVAEGRSKGFSEAIERAGSILYPNLQWRTLPRDHPVYSLYQSTTGAPPSLRGLSNGIRELIILSPTSDFSESFQSGPTRSEDQFSTGMNIYLYASEMNRGNPRVNSYRLDRDAIRIGTIPANIVRASHSGDWDVEPRALDVFAAWAWNERGLDVEMQTAPLDRVSQLQPAPDLVTVSGTTSVEFTPAERDSIRDYVASGGTILFESTGGVGDFGTSSERQLREIFAKPVRALMRHPVVSGQEMPGSKSISRVEYRPYSFNVFGAREVAPRLRGMLFDGNKPQVLISREDICNGLLDQPCWGICGYTSNWARHLLANITQYAAAND